MYIYIYNIYIPLNRLSYQIIGDIPFIYAGGVSHPMPLITADHCLPHEQSSISTPTLLVIDEKSENLRKQQRNNLGLGCSICTPTHS